MSRQQDPEPREGGPAVPEGESVGQDGGTKRHPRFQKGLQLYHESERSGFQNEDALKRGLQEVVDAAKDGVEDAINWIGTVFASKSAIPSSVVLPKALEKEMRLIFKSRENEKQVTAAAKSMFAKMVGSGPSKSIPKSEIDKCVEMLAASESGSVGVEARQAKSAEGQQQSVKERQQSIKRLMHSALKLSASDEITEEAFLKAAITFVRGEQVTAHEVTELSSQQLDEFDKANILKKVYYHPWLAFKFLKRTTLTAIEKYSVKWLWSIIPTRQFYILLLAYILPMLTVGFVVNTIASVVFVVAMVVMSLATLEIFLDSEKISSFKEYSSIFDVFSQSSEKIDTEASEEQFAKRTIGPYIGFSIALPLAIVLLGMAHQQLIFYEVLSIIAAAFAIAIFLEFECYKSPILMISVATRLVGWFYVFSLLVSQWIPIPEFLFLGVIQTVSIPIFPGIYVSVNLITLLQFPVQLVIIARLLVQNTWRNFYSGLGPFALFICWWVLCRNFLSRAKLTRFFVIIACLILIPFIPLLLMVSPIIAFVYFGFSPGLFIFLLVVIVISLLALSVGSKYSFLKEMKWHNIPLRYVFLVPIVISVPLILIGTNWYSTTHSPSMLPAITMPEYAKYCGPQNHDDGNMILTQLNCLHLKGRTFQGNGTVQSVKMIQISSKSSAKSGLKSLPYYIQTALLSMFRDTNSLCSDQENNTACLHTERDLQNSSFEIQLKMSDYSSSGTLPISVTLVAHHKFKPIVMKMKAGTELQFNSTFIDGMGSDKLVLQLTSTLMEEEFYEDQEDLEEIKKHLLSRLSSSVKEALFFLLEIFLGYTSPTSLHKDNTVTY